jgi:hypothetical protein
MPATRYILVKRLPAHMAARDGGYLILEGNLMVLPATMKAPFPR